MNTTSRDNIHGYTLHGNRYLNVSNRCNLYCSFCPRMQGDWSVQGFDLNLHTEPTVRELLDACDDISLYQEIVFCGLGEPTLRLQTILDVGRELKTRGARLRLNTNGLANQYHGRDITPELAGVIDVVSVSLNAQDATTYARYCQPRQPGSYEAVVEFIQHAKAHVGEISLTAIEGLAGVDIHACEALARRLGVGFRARFLDNVG